MVGGSGCHGSVSKAKLFLRFYSEQFPFLFSLFSTYHFFNGIVL